MSLHKTCSFLVLLLLINIYSSDSADKVTQTSSLSPNAAVAAVAADVIGVNSAVFKPNVDSLFSLNLLPFPEDLEISDYCSDLLQIFRKLCVAYVDCLVNASRPVMVCHNCYSSYGSFRNTYINISSDQMGPGNVSCRDSLLRSDRLMLVYLLYVNLEGIWKKSACDNCIAPGFQSLTNDTMYFMNTLNQTLTCFEKYQQGNHTELCKDCKSSYRTLNELYGRMENNHTMCIDIEDAMNVTRRLWSKKFNCSFPREETVPVIAVSSFMLFLPIIFYLSSFLHSEQKKRKLIHPKRAKSYTTLMNIQDKLS